MQRIYGMYEQCRNSDCRRKPVRTGITTDECAAALQKSRQCGDTGLASAYRRIHKWVLVVFLVVILVFKMNFNRHTACRQHAFPDTLGSLDRDTLRRKTSAVKMYSDQRASTRQNWRIGIRYNRIVIDSKFLFAAHPWFRHTWNMLTTGKINRKLIIHRSGNVTIIKQLLLPVVCLQRPVNIRIKRFQCVVNRKKQDCIPSPCANSNRTRRPGRKYSTNFFP